MEGLTIIKAQATKMLGEIQKLSGGVMMQKVGISEALA